MMTHYPTRMRRKASHLPFLMLLLGALLLPLGGAFAANKTAASLGGTPYTLPGGDFESPALPSSPGFQYSPSGSAWTLHSGAGLSRNGTGFTSGNPNAPQGSQVLFLQTGGRITQSIVFVAGTYTFDFYAAQRGNSQSSFQTFQLRVDGQAIQTFQPAGTSYQLMTSVPVSLTSGAHTIELRGLNPNGGDNTAFVDRFRATRQKELFLSGFESPAISGGFQYQPSGGPWTFTSGAGLSQNNSGFTSGNPGAPEGAQVLFLQGGGSATQSFSVPRTGFYRFRLRGARRGNHPSGGATKNLRVTFAGVVVGEFRLLNTSYEEYVTTVLYLNAGTYSLVLKGINPIAGDHAGFVDDLRMEQVHDWQDGQVWGGSVPNANDVVTVPAGSAVGMRGTLSANRVTVNGELIAAQNQNITASAKHFMLMGSAARMEVGQELAPYTSTANFTLTANSSDPDVMGMGNNFIGAMNGGELNLHGLNKLSWTHLDANAAAGATQITLAQAVNWKVGDEIVVVSSRTNWNEAEKRTITAISSNSKTLTLNASLNYPHTGVQQSYTDGSRTWNADLRAEVGLLSHNVKVQGNAAAAATGYGGHIMIMLDSRAYVSGVELYNMGQKALLGRYPFHWHMLGSVGQGQFFKNSAVHQSYNRAITIHGTESTLVENNFFYDHIGHGVFLEDGSERFNVIRKNVTLLSKRPAPGEEVTPSDNQFDQVQNRTPSSYWITNPQNTFEDNVAAGTQGTGYWFAFPTKPMGLSATDPRFSSMQPHTLPLISFKGNVGHSCKSGFDIFDQLNPDHSIKTNWGWAEYSDHVMDECLWYANDLALYSGIGVGGPSDNLIFRDNVFVENKVATMFASYSIVDASAFVANSGQSLASGQRYAYRVYDGAGQVHNSHFLGWNASNANLLLNTGAATKHPNHILTGNTTDHSGFVRCELPNFDVPPGYAGANDPEHPRFWSIVLRDLDGGLTGKANTSLICNHPFVRIGDEFQPSNWTRAYRSDRHYALSLLNYDLSPSQHPNVTVTRSKPGTPTAHVYYIDGFKEHHQLPFIVNDGFEYTYTYESLPSSRRVRMHMDDATAGDDYIARFKDFGKLGGLSLSSTQGSFPSYSSLASLQAASSSGYYRQSNGDLYIKAVATGKYQRFDISWNTGFTVPALDTDGDQMADGVEISNGRHPFTATDLAAQFNVNGDAEGWSSYTNVSGAVVSGGALKGTSINNGDAMVVNSAYNFAASEVPYIKIRMRSSQATSAQIFFATAAAPGFSGSRVVTASLPGGNVWTTLSFNMAGHSAWNGTVTDLRLDPVSGVGINFEIDWIVASQTAKAGEAEALSPEMGITVAPNPMQDRLEIFLGEAGAFHSLRLVDVQGRVLRTADLPPDALRFEWSLGEQPLPQGVYLLQFIGDGKMEQRKVLKVN